MNGEIIMEVIDNKFKKLGDDLKNTIKPNSKIQICASIFSMYGFESLKKELSKIEEKTRRVNSFRRDLANMLEQKYQASVQELKNNEDQVVDYEKMSQLFQLYYEANDEKFYRTLNSLDRESEKIQLEYKTKLRKKSEEIEDLQMKIHRLEDEG